MCTWLYEQMCSGRRRKLNDRPAWTSDPTRLKNYKINVNKKTASRSLNLSWPTTKWHNSMMNNMKSWDLVISFSHHKEESVKEFSKFTEKIPPANLCHLQGKINYLLHHASTESLKKLTLIPISLFDRSMGWHRQL